MQKGSIIQKHQEPIRFQPSKWTSSLIGGFSYKKTKLTNIGPNKCNIFYTIHCKLVYSLKPL